MGTGTRGRFAAGAKEEKIEREMMERIGWIDGRIIDLRDKVIEVEDRGYQFGDGVYEVDPDI